MNRLKHRSACAIVYTPLTRPLPLHTITPGGVVRIKFLWKDALLVTDPQALSSIMGRGDGALDKAAGVYATINYM